MLGNQQQKNLTKVLAGGLFLISVAVITEGLTDPVNIPKLLLLGVTSSTLIGLLISFRLNLARLGPARARFSLIIFLSLMVVAVLRSDSPLSQNIYGSYGRNNGFLAYLFLAILLFTTTLIPDKLNQLKIVKSLIYVGYVNLAYCLWVILFGDFIPWNNPYGNILGTFGNPNFIGAFLGIFFGAMLAIGVGNETSKNFKIALVFLLPLTLFVIVDSSAIQGRVLAALSIGIVGIFFLYFNFSHRLAYLFTLACVAIGVVALAGAFQRGPLAELIYKTSVSLRGQYWLAAWNTGQENPLSGAGMDAFGDWYRRSRDARAIELPGINTVVNTAHNVPLDMFAFGGWPLFIAYLTIMGVALKAAFEIARNMKSYDAVGVGLITTWTCYQVQSIISINQIGLAIWGWALSGGLIAYSRYAPESKAQTEGVKSSKKPKTKGTNDLKPVSVVYATIFGLVGLLISLPPFSADAKLRSAQVSRDAIKLGKTMESSLFNPLNSQKYLLNIQTLETSGLFELSHKYALEAVEWNPESYELWRLLFLIRNSTVEEKQLAVRKMKLLDPLNPDVMGIE
jgi:hypothetical protein